MFWFFFKGQILMPFSGKKKSKHSRVGYAERNFAWYYSQNGLWVGKIAHRLEGSGLFGTARARRKLCRSLHKSFSPVSWGWTSRGAAAVTSCYTNILSRKRCNCLFLFDIRHLFHCCSVEYYAQYGTTVYS